MTTTEATDPPPKVHHWDWCSRPPLRRSDDVLDRSRVRWRCPECFRTTYVLQREGA